MNVITQIKINYNYCACQTLLRNGCAHIEKDNLNVTLIMLRKIRSAKNIMQS